MTEQQHETTIDPGGEGGGPPGILGEKPVPQKKPRESTHHEGSVKETIISMVISLFMNWYNKRIALVER